MTTDFHNEITTTRKILVRSVKTLDLTRSEPQKRPPAIHVNWKFPPLFLTLVTVTGSLANWPTSAPSAVSPDETRVTRVNNSVQLQQPNRAPRPARLNEIVDPETVVRTGKHSHTELTFAYETVVRLAANTTFDFKNGTQDLNVTEGAALVQAPKSATGATIHAASVAAAIAGTTVMVEHHPGFCKFLVLEGTCRLYRPGHLGDSVLVEPGQMVMGNPSAPLSDPANFDIARFVKTSRFLVGLPPLRSKDSIAFEAEKQGREKSKKSLIDTNLVIFGGGTQVSLVGQESATKHPTPNLSPEAPPASQ